MNRGHGKLWNTLGWRKVGRHRQENSRNPADEIGLNWSVVAFLAALTLLLLGLGGLVILVCATVVGLVPLVVKVRRAQLMGFFLVPTMLFYSGQEGRVVDWLSL